MEPLIIAEWLNGGNASLDTRVPANGTHDENALLDEAGVILDDNIADEIFGRVVFKATNGKFYRGTVEFVLNEIDEDEARDLVED